MSIPGACGASTSLRHLGHPPFFLFRSFFAQALPPHHPSQADLSLMGFFWFADLLIKLYSAFLPYLATF